MESDCKVHNWRSLLQKKQQLFFGRVDHFRRLGKVKVLEKHQLTWTAFFLPVFSIQPITMKM